ncbi:hypothetical protein ACFXJ5_24830 [Streptomyces sp. NPDC059373]
MKSLAIEVAFSSPELSDAGVEAARQAVRALRADLQELPAVQGPVRRVPDAAVPGRQGGEVLQFAVALVPVYFEALVSLIQLRRESRTAGAEAVPLEATIRVTGPDGTREVVLKGEPDATVRTIQALQGLHPQDGGGGTGERDAS